MKRYNVLFLCTGNSCRSQMAEAIMNQRHPAKFRAFSAGSAPDLNKYPQTKGVHPEAIETLKRNHISPEGLESKSWDPFIRGSDEIDFVFTLCGDALKEVEESCPVFPGHPMSAHWGVNDPAKASGTEDEVRRIFQDVFLVIKQRIELFSNLPIEALEKSALQKRADDIGHSS